MRIIGFLQNLISKLLRFTSGPHSGMIVFMLSAPTAHQLNGVREHLRYWSFVKAFQPVDETHMRVLVFVGRGVTEKMWNYYVARSNVMMNQCVTQYQALFVLTSERPAFLLHKYHRNGFLRPDDLLKPFCDFIDEMNNQEQCSCSINNLNQ